MTRHHVIHFPSSSSSAPPHPPPFRSPKLKTFDINLIDQVIHSTNPSLIINKLTQFDSDQCLLSFVQLIPRRRRQISRQFDFSFHGFACPNRTQRMPTSNEIQITFLANSQIFDRHFLTVQTIMFVTSPGQNSTSHRIQFRLANDANINWFGC